MTVNGNTAPNEGITTDNPFKFNNDKATKINKSTTKISESERNILNTKTSHTFLNQENVSLSPAINSDPKQLRVDSELMEVIHP